MNKKQGIPTLSLFSGAGGLDLGFHAAGFDIVAAVEIEAKYCKTLTANQKQWFGRNTQIHNEDVTRFDPKPYRSQGIQCVIGGPPCQTFSAAGRRSGGVIGTLDNRGKLYEAYCSILDQIQPEVFVFENVYGLPGANNGEPWQEILSAFESHGYQLFSEVVDAADYGVPQHRERLIMVGIRGDREFSFPMPTHGPDSDVGCSLVSVLDAIGDLQSPKEKFSKGLGGLYGHLLPEVPEGLNYSYFTAEMGHPFPAFAWRSKFHDLLYKVNRNEPCRTIKASPGKFTGPLHWKNRHFTIGELKRLQTFPDDYELIGSYSQVLEQIGNSVPPRLAEVFATSVREQILEGKKKNLTYPTRPEGFQSTFRQRQRLRSQQFKEIAQKEIRKKYGQVASFDQPKDVKPVLDKYFTVVNGFDRSPFKKRPKHENYCAISVADANGAVRVDYDGIQKKQDDSHVKLNVKITGLRKYLPTVDSLCVDATLPNESWIFGCWKEIESLLVSRSKFFTLIDIYGHYANRGDVVNVETTIESSLPSNLLKSIEYFSQTENCGDFISLDDLLGTLDLSISELTKVVEQMRSLRYDLRTSVTHPIIGANRVLCTYPFPLLSPKALVESRVELHRAS